MTHEVPIIAKVKFQSNNLCTINVTKNVWLMITAKEAKEFRNGF